MCEAQFVCSVALLGRIQIESALAKFIWTYRIDIHSEIRQKLAKSTSNQHISIDIPIKVLRKLRFMHPKYNYRKLTKTSDRCFGHRIAISNWTDYIIIVYVFFSLHVCESCRERVCAQIDRPLSSNSLNFLPKNHLIVGNCALVLAVITLSSLRNRKKIAEHCMKSNWVTQLQFTTSILFT